MVVHAPDVPPLERLANWRIAVLALYALGAATTRKYGEDVAVRCHEFVPHRFAWAKYPQYPNLVSARDALADAKKQKNGAFVIGDEKEGWLLTKAGLAWCEKNARDFGMKLQRQGLSALAESEARAIRRVEGHRLFGQWRRGERGMTLYEVADALGFPADAPRAAVRRRVEELTGAARLGRMNEVEKFLEWLKENVVS